MCNGDIYFNAMVITVAINNASEKFKQNSIVFDNTSALILYEICWKSKFGGKNMSLVKHLKLNGLKVIFLGLRENRWLNECGETRFFGLSTQLGFLKFFQIADKWNKSQLLDDVFFIVLLWRYLTKMCFESKLDCMWSKELCLFVVYALSAIASL